MKRFLVGIGCVVFLWNVAMAGIVFDFNDTPVTTVVKYDTSVDPAMMGSPQTVDVANLLAANSYFWANPNGDTFADGRGAGVYDLAAMTYTQNGVSATFRGLAYDDAGKWGTYYVTGGTAISKNALLDYVAHGDYTRPNCTYVYADSPNNTALIVYDGVYGGESVDILPYLSPAVTFDTARIVESIDVANTCYVANIIQNGNGFSAPMSYADDDFFGITVSGLDKNGNVLEGKSKSFLLVDYLTYEDDQAALDTDVHDLTYSEATGASETTVSYTSLANGTAETWSTLMLEEFGEVFGLKFSLFSSDIGEFGMNTPKYFALDNLILRGAAGGETDVPEPAAWLLLAAGAGWLGIQIRRKISGRSLLHVER